MAEWSYCYSTPDLIRGGRKEKQKAFSVWNSATSVDTLLTEQTVKQSVTRLGRNLNRTDSS